MTGFLLSMFIDALTGESRRRLNAIGAFDTPPACPAARRYAAAAILFLMVGATLFLASSLVDVLAGDRFMCEVLGWSALGCFQVCFLCGYRYAAINQ